MKLSQLFEMPIIKNTDLPQSGFIRPFYTTDSIKRDFDFIDKGKLSDGSDYWVIVKKNLHLAVIGVPGLRASDSKDGMEIYGEAEFKHTPILNGVKKITVGKNVIQINLVQVSEKYKTRGFGFYLYLALAKAGYVVVSDNTQYIGGKELWKKLAKNVLNDGYAVYVIDHGEVKLNSDGDPIVYDGDNIDEAELWSENVDKKYTLFALRSKI